VSLPLRTDRQHGKDRCRACSQLVEAHNDRICPATRAPGFAKRGREPRRRERPDPADAFPEAAEWNTDGRLYCWPDQHTGECGCRPLTPNSFQDKDFQ
jgi:hypothetical protein